MQIAFQSSRTFVSRSSARLTPPLHRLHTPSNRITGRLSVAKWDVAPDVDADDAEAEAEARSPRGISVVADARLATARGARIGRIHAAEPIEPTA